MSTFSVINHIDCLVIEGVDARRFAQTQFSGDVDSLTPRQWQWNAWLTAQGRVQALMHLVDAGDGRLLAVLRGGDVQATLAGLARFLLRTQASIRPLACTGRFGGPLPMFSVQTQTGDEGIVLGFGQRSLMLGPRQSDAIDVDAQTAWRLTDIRAGWPSLPGDGQPRFLPPALGLEHLGAVSFGKGCFPGQEIAARLHYRGGHKHRLCHIRGKVPLPAGDIRSPDGAPQGCVLDTAAASDGYEALAVLDVNSDIGINILGNIYTIESRFDP